MARPASATIDKDILAALERFPSGIGIQQIEENLANSPDRRTIQRRLAKLIALRQVHREGQGRSTVYRKVKDESASVQAYAEYIIPLSAAAGEIEQRIRQSTIMRTPVGYNRRFLDAYRPNDTWYLSGEVRDDLLARGQAVSADEPAGTYARHLANRLLIDLSWNSSRLEGNTYSLLETERLISEGNGVAGKDAFEAQMILNHKDAIEFLISSAEEIGFNRYTILNLHALLSDNLLHDPTASGRVRSIPVGIAQTTFLPLENPHLIEECFDQVLDTAAAIDDPFEQAFFAMVHFPYLQPFEDVNKRVSRLAANIPLIRRNLCPLSFVDVPQPIYISATLGIYELNRIELLRDVFVWAYKRSCARYSAVRQSLGDPDPFRLRYRQQIAQAVLDVVNMPMNKQQAINHLRQFVQSQINMPDRARFIEIVETQLMNLHDGNIARYHLRPGDFYRWRKNWI